MKLDDIGQLVRIRGLVDSGGVACDGCWPCGSRLLTIEGRTRS